MYFNEVQYIQVIEHLQGSNSRTDVSMATSAGCTWFKVVENKLKHHRCNPDVEVVAACTFQWLNRCLRVCTRLHIESSERHRVDPKTRQCTFSLEL